MNTETTKNLLVKYQSTDELREGLMLPFRAEWGGAFWTAATDANQFIMFPETDENKVLQTSVKPPNLGEIIPELDLNIPCDVSRLIAAYDSIKVVKEGITKECESCEGDGYFEHFGNDYNCKSCDEDGTVGTGEFEEIKDPHVRIEFNGAWFDSDFIKNLIDVCEALGENIFSITRVAKEKVNVFMVGGVMVGIMPIHQEAAKKHGDTAVTVDLEQGY